MMGGADEGQMRGGVERFVDENSTQQRAPPEAQTTNAALAVAAVHFQHVAAQFQPAKKERKSACRVQQKRRPSLWRPTPSMLPQGFSPHKWCKCSNSPAGRSLVAVDLEHVAAPLVDDQPPHHVAVVKGQVV